MLEVSVRLVAPLSQKLFAPAVSVIIGTAGSGSIVNLIISAFAGQRPEAAVAVRTRSTNPAALSALPGV
jgi:hypothetical protein